MRGEVEDHEHSRWQVSGQITDQLGEDGECAGGTTDDDNVASGHGYSVTGP